MNPQPASWIRYWGPLAAWCSLIFIVSGIPNLNSGLEQDYPLRKAAHIIEYAVLMRLWLRARDGTFGCAPRRLAVGGLFCALYAASDEFHQSFVPGRSGSGVDVAIDMIGIAAEAARDKWGSGPPRDMARRT